MINYTDALRQHNLKATPQRLEIADILQKCGHITIEKLYEKMLQRFNSISQATIYKNINLMLESAFIQEVKIPNQKTVYEITKATHSHLACSSCSSVEDITLDLSDITKNITLYDFQVDRANLVLTGLCKECQ